MVLYAILILVSGRRIGTERPQLTKSGSKLVPWHPCDQHEVEPIPGWSGRYKCIYCGVVLYRGVVLDTQISRRRQKMLIAYKCPKCHGQTTGRERTCPACRAVREEAANAKAINNNGDEKV